MAEAIVSIVVTVFIYLAGFFLLKKRSFLRKKKSEFIKRTCFVGALNIFLLLLCFAWMLFYTTPRKTEIAAAACAVSLLAFLGFAVAPFLPKEATGKLLRGCAVLCILPFLLELFVFNAKSFDLKQKEYIPAAIAAETPDTVRIDGESIYFTGAGSVVIHLDQTDLKAVEMNFSGTDHWFKCTASMTDGNYETRFIPIGESYCSTDYGYGSFSFEPYKGIKSFRLSLAEMEGQVCISDIRFSSALPFEFSNIRFFGLAAAGILIYLICRLKLYRVVYNDKFSRHRAAVAAVLFLLVLSAFAFLVPEQKMIDYETADIASSDPYVQMFDAVKKGQVNLDIPVSEGLKAMDNPYDWQQRIDKGVSYAWDRAYFEGEYYSYFGIAPVFVLYFPFYFLTGSLPTLNVTICFFSILSIVFLLQTILTMVRMFIKKPNLLLLLLGLCSSVFCSGIYYALDFTDIYFPAKVSGICFMLLCVWLGLLAYESKSAPKKQNALLAASGLSFVLCVGCRPSVALSALILAPAFLFILFDKAYSLKRKIGCAASFLVPLALGAAGLMWYNSARFGSPFDFGAAYQLTVSNVSANTLRLSEFPAAVIHYFLQPFAFASGFPFFRVQTMALGSYGHYVYNDSFFGVINFPCVFLALIAGICILVGDRKKQRRLTRESNLRYFTYLSLILLSFLIAWAVFCQAGVVFGYMLDILPVLTLLMVLVSLDVQERLAGFPAIQSKATGVIGTLMVLTMAIVFLQLLTYNGQNLFKRFPDIWFALEHTMVFWN